MSPAGSPTGSRFDDEQREHWADRTNLRRHDHPVVRAFTDRRMRCVRSLLGALEPRTALDVGCGDGFGMGPMGAWIPEVHGCDQSREMLAANPAPDDRLHEANAYDLSRWDDGAFDLVYCWELLHHIGEPQRVVDEMARIAGRAVLLCEPNALNPAMAAFGIAVKAERGLLRFGPGTTRKLLERAGLMRIRSMSVECFTPNQSPEWMPKVASMLPYRFPLVGLYSIAVGWRA